MFLLAMVKLQFHSDHSDDALPIENPVPVFDFKLQKCAKPFRCGGRIGVRIVFGELTPF
jgi:hypothetical protein